jgi:hypothetical protein
MNGRRTVLLAPVTVADKPVALDLHVTWFCD